MLFDGRVTKGGKEQPVKKKEYVLCVCVDMSKHVSAEIMKRCGSDPCVKTAAKEI